MMRDHREGLRSGKKSTGDKDFDATILIAALLGSIVTHRFGGTTAFDTDAILCHAFTPD